ncbi:MAG TPA: glycosyltransferase family 2 protein [Gemmatimonadaceae bacterium]|nr:glycosyltransferase family 2 protein [Gemmatimonadaceae bacterium]
MPNYEDDQKGVQAGTVSAVLPDRAAAATPRAARIRDEVVLAGSRRAVFVLLTTVLLVAVGAFAVYWAEIPGAEEHPVLYALASAGLFYLIGVWLMPWLAVERMRRPVHVDPAPGWRVAVMTTFTPPTESVEMLEQTLAALVALDYPHDTWVLDEGNVPEVRTLCDRLGVRHFSRFGRPEYQTPSGRFARRSKFGNINAWLDQSESAEYDLLAAFDPDHVPERDYLLRTLGYFSDPEVGYVQAAQFYYNQAASFVARGAAEESYDFYSSGQMANHAFGEPAVVGSHTVHRLAALRAFGGVPAHEAEDLYLALLYRWARWRGVYVPEILAMGTTPVDWRAYLRQQRRWTRSLLDLKLRVLPKVAPRMTPTERARGLLHGTYFLRPLVFVAWYPMLVYMLVADVQPTFYHRYAFYALFSLATVFFCVDRFRQLYYLDRKGERGIHWRSLVLLYAKWPYFAQALWQAVRGWRGTFAVTPKVETRSVRGSIAVPHLTLAFVMAAALGTRVALHGVPRPALLGTAAGFIVFSALLACTELLNFPPTFERGLYARSRAALRERLRERA